MPANTIRAWTIGLLLTTICAGLNSLFSLRAPSITITSIVIQLIAYPIGQGWDLIMPDRVWKVGRLSFNLKPGPFNMKEHTIIVVMGNANFGGGFGYFLDTFTALKGFYHRDVSFGWAVLVALTTQCIGFGIAGMVRTLLVDPASAMWPSQLVNCALMYTLHDRKPTDPAKTNGWSISRYRLFLYIFIGSFIWYWFPGYIAPFLSIFAWVTWIKPDNVIINQLFGGSTGLSLIPITFDWTYISGYIYSPLISPWHATANILISTVLWFQIVSAAIHYSGTWYSKYLPMSDFASYDNTASPYNVSSILTPDFKLDVAAYEAYSPLYLSTTFSLCYGLSFATLSSLLVHVGLFYGKDIWNRLFDPAGRVLDIHTKLMNHYPKVPMWWYMSFFVAMLAMTFGAALGFDTGLTWWAVILAFIIAGVFTVPIGIIQAMTNVQIGLNVLTEFLIGYMLPGRPLAMMLFKTYGYITMSQALYFAQDMKLGHYLKVPPRTMFAAQAVATLWGCVVQVAVFFWAFANIEGICKHGQSFNFTCPSGKVFFNASVIWGLIGPKRIFSPGALYSGLNWFWFVGAALPVAIYVGARMFPKSKIRYLNAPVIFGGTGNIPPATPLNYLAWCAVGFVFNKYIKDRYRGWWMRFNYVTSAGLDTGLAISTIFIFLTLSLTLVNFPTWWGGYTGGSQNTLDITDSAIQSPPPANPGYFGPGPGQFH